MRTNLGLMPGGPLTQLLLPAANPTAHVPHRLRAVDLRAQRKADGLCDAPFRAHGRIEELPEGVRDGMTCPRAGLVSTLPIPAHNVI